MLDPSSPLPPGLRLLNAAGGSLRAARLPVGRLDEEGVTRAAVKKTGLSDFGAPYHREGLSRLLDAAGEAGLHFLGRLGYRDLIVTALVNRLLLVEARKRTPEVFRRPLFDPIIILGLPRSGTTLLHRLLALDPSHRGIPQWELVHPLPNPGPGSRPDRRRHTFRRKLEYGQRLLPNMDHKHYSRTDTPEECMWLLAVTFLSPVYWVFAPVYGYLDWYMAQDRLQSYREYRSLLQVLQAVEPSRRLALKAPAHTGALDALLRTIPNALLIQTHRDPVQAISSLNSLFFSLHGGMTDRLDVGRMARANLAHQAREMALNLAARDAHPGPVVFDVYYERLVADPVGTVRGIYEHFGLSWPEAFERRLTSYVRDNPRGKHGTHRYRAEDFGQTDRAIAERFAPYSQRFGLAGSGTYH